MSDDLVRKLGELPGGVSRVTIGQRSIYFEWCDASWRVGFDLVVWRVLDTGGYVRSNLALAIERVLRAAERACTTAAVAAGVATCCLDCSASTKGRGAASTAATATSTWTRSAPTVQCVDATGRITGGHTGPAARCASNGRCSR